MHVHIFALCNDIWTNWWIFIQFGMAIVPSQATSYFWFPTTESTMTVMQISEVVTGIALLDVGAWNVRLKENIVVKAIVCK
jgi:hypothetical protein